jgi:hypothetical protein
MPFSDPIVAKKYREKRNNGLHEQSKVIICACGCKGTLKERGRSGNIRKFITGHGRKVPEGHISFRVLNANRILCACGCKEYLLDRNKYGNKQSYISGHVNRNFEPSQPPKKDKPGTISAERSRASRWARKMSVLKYYGGDPPVCACCFESHVQFLAIDHVNRDGAEHRRKLKNNGGNIFYLWLVNNDYPDGFRVLCHNCNMAIGIWGSCPHELERK